MRVVQMHPFSSPPASANHVSVMENTSESTQSTAPSLMNKILDFKAYGTDDWILLGIIATLILEGSEDYILLCALGYLFIMGF